MKDSKKFTSKKKITECYEYIKENATAYAIEYQEPHIIDKINIREATLLCMHNAITKTLNQIGVNCEKNTHLLIDGNDFRPYISINDGSFNEIPHTTIKGGDNIHASIAAASILAKVERDKYIEELCLKNTILIDNYDILSNKGYGTKKHMDGITTNGITNLHRKSYGICKDLDVKYQIITLMKPKQNIYAKKPLLC